MTFAVLAIPIYGKLADIYKYKDTVLVAYTLKISALFAFQFVENPKSFFLYMIFMILAFGMGGQSILTNSVFTKNIRKDIRGTMLGANQFFGGIGVLTYTKVGAYLHDNYGPKYPFMFILGLDVILFTLIIILRLTKYLD